MLIKTYESQILGLKSSFTTLCGQLMSGEEKTYCNTRGIREKKWTLMEEICCIMTWNTRSLVCCIKRTHTRTTLGFAVCLMQLQYDSRVIKLPVVSTLQRVKSNIWFAIVSTDCRPLPYTPAFFHGLFRKSTAQTEQAASCSPGLFEDKNKEQIGFVCCLVCDWAAVLRAVEGIYSINPWVFTPSRLSRKRKEAVRKNLVCVWSCFTQFTDFYNTCGWPCIEENKLFSWNGDSQFLQLKLKKVSFHKTGHWTVCVFVSMMSFFVMHCNVISCIVRYLLMLLSIQDSRQIKQSKLNDNELKGTPADGNR